MNETTLTRSELITSDSVFRLISVSKNFAAFSALVVENESRSSGGMPLTLDTPVKLVLPNFGLPDADWENGGSEITLAMLGSHSSGLPREGYSTGFNMVTALAKASSDGVGSEWAGVGSGQILDFLRTRNLMFAPGQRAACKYRSSVLLASTRCADASMLTATSRLKCRFCGSWT